MPLARTEEPPTEAAPASPSPPPQAKDAPPSEPTTRQAVIAALVQADGNISAAARGLGLHRTQLRRLLLRYDVDPALVRGATRR